jgi:hypothetical protein
MTDPRASVRLGSLLRSRTFLLLEARGTAAGVGYTVYLGTVLWLSFQLTAGIFLAGIVLGVETAVYTLTFLVGPIVDRLNDKRWVFLVCYPVQAVAALALGLTYVLGLLSIPLLLGIVVLLAVLWDFSWAADSAATRLLFGRERLFAISGLGTALGGAVNIAMYFAAGATIALLGAAGGSYLYAGLLAAGTVLAVPLSIPTPNAKTQNYRAGLKEGWTPYRGVEGKPLRQLSLVQFIYGFFTTGPLLLLTLSVGRSFAASQTIYAELYVAYLVGGILIGLVLGKSNPRLFIGYVAMAALLGTAVLLTVATIVTGSIFPSLVVWALIGAATTARLTAFSNYMQGRFAPELLARISANNYLFTGASSAVGALVIGELSQSWSFPMLTGFIAFGFAAAGVFGLLLPGTRTLSF